jgi:tripartite-type tricarboxylate transporter receptor subunit TctC
MIAHASCGAWAASAPDTYPSRPIRMIVGFTPGGSDDYVGRVVANRLTERFGQSVIVDNRPGTGGNLGAEITARANPDGYTLSSVGSITVASGPSLYTKLGYDPLKDFAYVARVAIGANVLYAHPSVPAKSVKELVALARAQPKAIRYGTPGVASLGHLAVELLQSVTRIELLHVPYKGPAPALTAVVGGEVQVGVGASSAVIPVFLAKRVNALAVTSAKRLGAVPDVPTVAESGFPGFDVTNNHGIVAPAGTPASVVRLLSAEIQAMMRVEEIRSKFPTLGLEPAASTPEEFTDIVRAELEKWTRVIRDANIKAN